MSEAPERIWLSRHSQIIWFEEQVDEDDIEYHRAPEWVSVKDRLPEEGCNVLAYNAVSELVEKVYYVKVAGWVRWDGSTNPPTVFGKERITHWMPLPLPPGEEE